MFEYNQLITSEEVQEQLIRERALIVNKNRLIEQIPTREGSLFIRVRDMLWTIEQVGTRLARLPEGTYTYKRGEYTYNTGSHTERDFIYHIFTDEDDYAYLTLQFQVGRDARVGFTDVLLYKFDTLDDLMDNFFYKKFEYNTNVEYNRVQMEVRVFVNYVGEFGDFMVKPVGEEDFVEFEEIVDLFDLDDFNTSVAEALEEHIDEIAEFYEWV